jgi:peptidoglycan/LPS O-acetylase OafA/YrhL
MIILDIIFKAQLIPIKLILGNILGLGAFTGTHSVLSHTWFVTYILLCYLMTPILSKFLNLSHKKEFDVFKLCVSLFIIAFIFNFFGIVNFNMFWIVNYILGYVFSKYYIMNKMDYNKFMDLLIIFLILLLPVRLYIEFNLLNSSNFLVLKFCDGYHVLLGCSIFVILYRIFSNFNFKAKTKKVLDFFDKYSYFIYLVHQIFILNKYSCLFITDYLIINIIIIILCSILSAICLFKLNNFVTKIFSKINWRNKNEQES